MKSREESRVPNRTQAPSLKELEMNSKETSIQQEGFSLIELLIVVAIIGIIAAIAVPHLLASKRAANEASAQASLRTIHNCEATYRAANGDVNYGTLNDLKVQYLTDSVLASGTKSGYYFAATPLAPTSSTAAQFYTTAIPTSTSGIAQTGTRRFAMTEDGVLRSDTTLSVPTNHAAVLGMPPVNN
jgi:type IV pilus assembly protein PilA